MDTPDSGCWRYKVVGDIFLSHSVHVSTGTKIPEKCFQQFAEYMSQAIKAVLTTTWYL